MTADALVLEHEPAAAVRSPPAAAAAVGGGTDELVRGTPPPQSELGTVPPPEAVGESESEFLVRLAAVRDPSFTAPPVVRLRSFLKVARRQYGLRAVSLEPNVPLDPEDDAG